MTVYVLCYLMSNSVSGSIDCKVEGMDGIVSEDQEYYFEFPHHFQHRVFDFKLGVFVLITIIPFRIFIDRWQITPFGFSTKNMKKAE